MIRPNWSRCVFLAWAVSLACSSILAGTSNTAGGKQASVVYWFQNLSGSLAGQSSGGQMSADITAEGNAQQGYAFTLKTLGSFTLDFIYAPLMSDSTFSSNQNFTFAGTQFGNVSDGNLRYRMPIFEGALRYIILDNRWFRLSTAAVLKVAQADVTLSSNNVTKAFQHTIPIPMLGVSGQVNATDWLKAYGSVKMFDVTIGSVECRVDDWEVGAMADMNPSFIPTTLRMATGYRTLGVLLATEKNQPDEAALDIRHSGPFAEMSLAF